MKDLTPEEKAKELVGTFDESMEFYTPKRFSKQCAIIAVDEILKSHYKLLTGVKSSIYNYYQEVKQEIEKL